MQKDRVYGVLSYLGFLVLIPMIKNENEFQHFHAEQGLTLYLISSSLMVIANFIPFLSTVVAVAAGILTTVFAVLGIVNVCNNKMQELPVIGIFKFLK